jgi:hypothetical protein
MRGEESAGALRRGQGIARKRAAAT